MIGWRRFCTNASIGAVTKEYFPSANVISGFKIVSNSEVPGSKDLKTTLDVMEQRHLQGRLANVIAVESIRCRHGYARALMVILVGLLI